LDVEARPFEEWRQDQRPGAAEVLRIGQVASFPLLRDCPIALTFTFREVSDDEAAAGPEDAMAFGQDAENVGFGQDFKSVGRQDAVEGRLGERQSTGICQHEGRAAEAGFFLKSLSSDVEHTGRHIHGDRVLDAGAGYNATKGPACAAAHFHHALAVLTGEEVYGALLGPSLVFASNGVVEGGSAAIDLLQAGWVEGVGERVGHGVILAPGRAGRAVSRCG